MKKNVFRFAILFMSMVTIFTASCNKGDADAQSAEDAARGSYIMADAFAMANSGSTGKSLKDFTDTQCFEVVAFETGEGFFMNFNNCVDEYGVTYNGTIKVSASAQAWTNGSAGQITIEFIDYTNGNEAISGKITAQVTTGLLGISFSIGAENLKITYADGKQTYLEEADLTFSISLTTILEGFVISGHSKGVNRNGVSYSSISEDIKYQLCPWPKVGTINIEIDGEKDIVVNFDQDGKGACDRIILVSQKRHDDVTVTID